MKHVMRFRIAFAAVLLAASGCGQESQTPTTAAYVDVSRYVLAAEPGGAQGVMKVRESAVDGEEVVLVGRIGGSQSPWVEGRAAFSVVDSSLELCTVEDGGVCPCCVDELANATALVKVVDDQGKLLAADARHFFHLKQLQTVVVRGKAKRDDGGNLTILAREIFVRDKDTE